VVLEVENLNGRIDFDCVFGRSGPVQIELGCGKGSFLVNQARARPEVNFLGIEKASRYYRISVGRAGRWGIENVRIIRIRARPFLAELAHSGSRWTASTYSFRIPGRRKSIVNAGFSFRTIWTCCFGA